ncbi:hypothetical protein H8A97_09640 [Bradyrhizobium sp. Arg62]|uniref:hypothetical protein n=1 Tax=Bradyrhizobium brasilense TaxID=1419277 RepID=UPI001E3F0609|nr:hypothetical protein [Bradyrhizobium brasilense]MCC8945355.1 hypothetical protein [Bradyrhizobium brasilense]
MLDVARESSDWFAQVLTVDNTGAISREAVEIQRREYHGIYGDEAGDALIEQEYFCSFEAAGRSVAVLWGLFLTGIGTVFQWLDPIAAALGDPDLKAQVMEALEDNPQYLAYVLMGISAITIAARLRSVGKA